MRLSDALLCLDCDFLVERRPRPDSMPDIGVTLKYQVSSVEACPCCTSTSLMPLSKFIPVMPQLEEMFYSE